MPRRLIKTFYQKEGPATIRLPYVGLKKHGFLRMLTLKKSGNENRQGSKFRLLFAIAVQVINNHTPIYGVLQVYTTLPAEYG
jgi:hypothetical protein